MPSNYPVYLDVALRKESVDRNNAMNMTERNNDKESLSARRAWIEIQMMRFLQLIAGKVALRKESVDRNLTLIF